MDEQRRTRLYQMPPIDACLHCRGVMDEAQKRRVAIKFTCPSHEEVEIDGRDLRGETPPTVESLAALLKSMGMAEEAATVTAQFLYDNGRNWKRPFGMPEGSAGVFQR